MKIAIDLLPIREDGSAGGATGFAIELTKGLAATDGIQVLVLCADWNIKYLRKNLPKNVQLYETTKGSGKGFLKISIINRVIHFISRGFQSGTILARNKVDILYCPFGAISFKEKGIPVVSTILDIQHEFYPLFFEPQELQHRRKFYQDIVKNAEWVTCISDYTRQTFCEKYHYPEDKAQTIYIAIQNRFSQYDDSILEKLHIRKDEYIVYPANFWEHKNHKLLLNAFAMFAKKNRYIKLVLTGNSLGNEEYYTKLQKAMGIDDRVVITGYLKNEELYSILKNAKGLIYPSLFEGFGIPVVEAMYLNKLIACSNLTSLPEIGCSAIYYFNPKKPDEIVEGLQYISNNKIKNEQISEYKKKLEDYQTKAMVNAYIDVFTKVKQEKKVNSFHEELLGIYKDGWAESKIIIRLKNRHGYKVKVRLLLPGVVKFTEKVAIEHNGKRKKYSMKPGEILDIEEILSNEEETILIHLSKTWVPQKILDNGDVRQLSVMVNDINLISKDNSYSLLEELKL